MRDTEAVAVARLALGRQLAAWRRSVGLTQETFADEVNYARSSIAGVETGNQLGTRAFWRCADEIVQAKGTLLASFDELSEMRRSQHRPVGAQGRTLTQDTRAACRHQMACYGEPAAQLIQGRLVHLVKATLGRELRELAGVPALVFGSVVAGILGWLGTPPSDASVEAFTGRESDLSPDRADDRRRTVPDSPHG